MNSSDRASIVEAYLVAAKHGAMDREYAATLPHRRLTCVVCGHEECHASLMKHRAVCRFNGGHLERYHCPECSALFGPMKMLDMTAGELATEYSILYASYSEGDTSKETVRSFMSMNPEVGPVYLDWGCGWWSDAVHDLREQGWNAWGYEPTQGGPKPYVVTDYSHIAPGVAGIFSNNVIEHLQNPVEEFHKMRRLMNAGSKMAHSSPCYEALYLDTRFHTVFLLEESIRVLAARTGFDVLDRQRDGEYMNTVFVAV